MDKSLRKLKTSESCEFNIEFVLISWDILKGDILKLFNDCFEGRTILSCINFFCVALILKFGGACNPADFWPIALEHLM